MLKINLSVNKFIHIILSVTLCAFLVCGCSVKTENSSDTQDSVTFKDALDRNITLSKNPQRVAALIGSFADVWQLAGGDVCATADDAWEDFGLELKNAINIGGAHSPSVELLLSANPDFVIASASTRSNVEMKEILENAGITVAYFDIDCFEDYLAMLKICTDITGRDDLYIKYGTEIEKQIKNIKNSLKEVDIPEQQRTMLLLRASSGAVKVKGSKGTILGEMLKDMGCINIADNNKGLLENLNVENIISCEPYRIFVVTMGDEKAASDNIRRIINENPIWNELEAVKEERFYIMDRKLFNLKPNARWAEAYEKLQEILQ